VANSWGRHRNFSSNNWYVHGRQGYGYTKLSRSKITEILESEIKREEYGIENKPEGERKGIEKIYQEKGFTGEELNIVVNRITSSKKVWLKTMLTEKLEPNPDIIGNPLKGAIVMFISFLVGGFLPILPYFLVKTGLIDNFTALMVAISISLTSSFIIGAIKGKLAEKRWIKRGLEMSLLGTGIALLGYGIGSEMNNLGVVNFD
jgi:vacuolar iron transporter family protein